MYVFRNALSNIKRSKGRSILFGIIVFIIAISACLALSIREAAETTRAEGLKKLSITGSITLDMDKAIGEGQKQGERPGKSEMKKNFQASQLSLAELEKYSKLSSVNDFYYTGTATADALKIDAISTGDGGMGGRMMGGPGGQQAEIGDFTITGYSSDSAMKEFAEGNASISKGKLFTEGTSENTCIISNTLAKYNDLSVGDTIKMKSASDSSKTFRLKIVGIYKQTVSSESNQMQGRGMMGSNANNICISYNALTKIAKSADLNVNTRGTYAFADYASYQKFESQAHKAGLADKYTVESPDIRNYERQLRPLDNLSTYAKYFLLIMLIIGGAVLLILTMFSIRERKYEIGVLAAIGMNKRKIGRQFIYEIAAVSIAAIMLGGLIGSLASVPVTNALLSATVSSTSEESFDRGGLGDGQPGQPPAERQDQSNDSGREGLPQMRDYVDSVTSASNLKVTLEMILIGLALIAVSGTAAMTGVMKYDPLSILTTGD